MCVCVSVGVCKAIVGTNVAMLMKKKRNRIEKKNQRSEVALRLFDKSFKNNLHFSAYCTHLGKEKKVVEQKNEERKKNSKKKR